MIKMDAFLDAFQNGKPEKIVQFATVDSGYIEGHISLIFDGESTPTIKEYPYLRGDTLLAGDRVMVIHGVIIGAIV